jgi:hypothetical protein
MLSLAPDYQTKHLIGMGMRRHWVPLLTCSILMEKSSVQPFTKGLHHHFLKVGTPLQDSNCVSRIRGVKPLVSVVPLLIPGLKFLVQLWVFMLREEIGKILVSNILTVILFSFLI